MSDAERAPLIRKVFELMPQDSNSKADVLTEVTIIGLKDGSGRSISAQTFDKLLRTRWIGSPQSGPYFQRLVGPNRLRK